MSEWTVETLKQHFDSLREADQEAIKSALTANEKRFDSVNEFRGQLNDQVATFLPRKEYDARHETLESRVTDLTNRMNSNDGQAKGSQITTGKVIAIVSVSVGVLGLILSLIVLMANGKLG